jgi:hypothetical protein
VLREALKRMGRADLIGNGQHHLVPAYQPVGPRPALRPFRTQHTGLPKSGTARRGAGLKKPSGRSRGTGRS